MKSYGICFFFLSVLFHFAIPSRSTHIVMIGKISFFLPKMESSILRFHHGKCPEMYVVFLLCYQGGGEKVGNISLLVCLETATEEKLMCLSHTGFKLFNLNCQLKNKAECPQLWWSLVSETQRASLQGCEKWNHGPQLLWNDAARMC